MRKMQQGIMVTTMYVNNKKLDAPRSMEVKSIFQLDRFKPYFTYKTLLPCNFVRVQAAEQAPVRYVASMSSALDSNSDRQSRMSVH